MKKVLMFGAACAVVALAAGTHMAAQQPAAGGGGGRGGGRGGRGGGPVTVEMKDGTGKSVGTATITPAQPMGVSIAYDFKGLPPGVHAFHIHAVAKCEGPDFMTAGGHFNPDMKKHGMENPDGPHAGDMANFTVAADGTAKGTATDTMVAMGGRGANGIFANGGTALMIHAAADDNKTDPSGNAGARIACGTITPPAPPAGR
jgi:Cu-Zn family superoxide dismutase